MKRLATAVSVFSLLATGALAAAGTIPPPVVPTPSGYVQAQPVFPVDQNGNPSSGTGGGPITAAAGAIVDLQTLLAQQSSNFGGFSSGVVSVSVTPSSSSHAAGTSNGGWILVPVARTVGNSGLVVSFTVLSYNGNTVPYQVYWFQTLPTATTCTDNFAYASATADLPAALPSFLAAPAALSGVTYTQATGAPTPISYKTANGGSPTNYLYVCLVNTATNTVDNNHPVQVSIGAAND